MLHAILLNKAGRSLESGEVHWRQLFTASEDSLTSTILGNLLHLPSELFWEILNKSCYGEKLTTLNPRILSVEFWPGWTLTGSNNARSVEPDVFIRTTQFDLIIEAKRFDKDQQSYEQWYREFDGYINDYGDEQKDVVLLALGGITNEEPENIEIAGRNMRILKCRWIRILDEIKIAQVELEKSRTYMSSIDSILMILTDTIMGFGIHGYSTGTWLEDEDFSRIGHIDSYSLTNLLSFKQE